MLGPERRTACLLTFSLLLWDHGRWLWEGLANLAISSRISSYGGEKGREERGTDFSAGKQGAFIFHFKECTMALKPSYRARGGLSPAFFLCEGQPEIWQKNYGCAPGGAAWP